MEVENIIMWIVGGVFLFFLVLGITNMIRVDKADEFCKPYTREGIPKHVENNTYVVVCGDGLHNASLIHSGCARIDKYGLCKSGLLFVED